MASHLELGQVGSLGKDGYLEYKVNIDSVNNMVLLLVGVAA